MGLPVSYRGRFAPSPTGPLHAGSLVAALASWLDARAHGGAWLVRMEDVDKPRCSPEAARTILWQLEQLGLHSDEPVLWQSTRDSAYQSALGALLAGHRAYPCTCSRSAIAAANAERGVAKPRFGELVYPGTCRQGVATSAGDPKGSKNPAFRLFVQHPRHYLAINNAAFIDSNPWRWHDRRLGPQTQNIAASVGDFVLKRADGLWAYQLAVVVDDAAQGITHVVRGQDLADNTARQMLLQASLTLPAPLYLHTPLVLGDDGEKLSKRNGAAPLDLSHPLAVHSALNAAARVLGLPQSVPGIRPCPADPLRAWIAPWLAQIQAAAAATQRGTATIET